MSGEAYELLAYIARYWFALLGALVVWRAWRAVVRDNRAQKPLRAWEGGAGCVGELVLTDDGTRRKKSQSIRFLVPQEAVLGSAGKADIRLRGPGIKRRHLYMTYQPGEMTLHPAKGAEFSCKHKNERGEAVLRDGDKLTVGRYTLMMVFFSAADAQPSPRKNVRPRQLLPEDISKDEFEDVWE